MLESAAFINDFNIDDDELSAIDYEEFESNLCKILQLFLYYN